MPTEAPVAPAAPTSAPPSTPPPASAAPINVTTAAIDKGPTAPAPKPGSARDKMFGDLRKKAGIEPETKPAPAAATATTTATDAETTTEMVDPSATESTTPATGTTPAAPKGKVSPWKLVDEHKAARLKAEQEVAELRKTMADPAKIKEIEERASKIEARAKELEEHIKYVDYSKSQEFADKYQKPYTEAWTKWMGELGELTVADPASGGERPIAPNDLLELVNMPLGKAREQADSVFGAFADDVMSARKEIKDLFLAQNKALEEAKKMGTEREAKQQQEMTAKQQEVQKHIGELWKKSNEMAQADEKYGQFFKPIEGDEDGNARLKRGYELTDKAFSVSPTDPRLTPDQRAEVVQIHAAVRNRAAAFGRLAAQKAKLEKDYAALKAELDKFKSVQPGAGEGSRGTTPASGHSSARDSVFADLRARAR